MEGYGVGCCYIISIPNNVDYLYCYCVQTATETVCALPPHSKMAVVILVFQASALYLIIFIRRFIAGDVKRKKK